MSQKGGSATGVKLTAVEGVSLFCPTKKGVSVFSKSVLNWGGGGCLQYDILEILNFVGFFLIIVGQTFKIMLIKNNCH